MEGQLQRILGRNLLAIRKARGISQEDFAHVIGYHRTYAGSLERGERNLSLQRVERLAGRLDVEAIDLLTEGAFGA